MTQHDVDIDRLFEPGQEGILESYLRLLHPADVAELFDYVDIKDWQKITRRLSPEVLADVLAELDEGQRSALGAVLNTEQLVEAVEELETDDAADVLADLPDEMSAVVLPKLEDREEIAALLAYPDDSAGGIMQTELCRVPEGSNVAEAIEAVREAREIIDDVLEVYVVDPAGRPTGTVALEELVVSKPYVSVESIEEPIEAQVTPEIDQEKVAMVFRKYDLYTLPVVDSDGVLLGRITYDDIHDVLEEEASEDLMASVGASAEDLVYSSAFFRISLLRLPWLTTSFCGSIVTGFLLSLFGRFSDEAIVMASFVPVVMAMTGNVGSQSAMIITRGFAIGRVDMATLGRTFLRELSVGLIMGGSAGVLVGVIAFFWQGNPGLGLSVGLAMGTSMSAAAVIGTTTPALFKRLGIDPAIASGPLVTTLCDLMGVSVYLMIALLILT